DPRVDEDGDADRSAGCGENQGDPVQGRPAGQRGGRAGGARVTLRASDRPGPSGGTIRTLEIVRPEKRNALDPETLEALAAAVDEAKLSLPPAKLGIAYAPGGLARLVALVGAAHAKRLALVAEVIDAERAREIGLVDETCADVDLDARIAALADGIAQSAPLA